LFHKPRDSRWIRTSVRAWDGALARDRSVSWYIGLQVREVLTAPVIRVDC